MNDLELEARAEARFDRFLTAVLQSAGFLTALGIVALITVQVNR